MSDTTQVSSCAPYCEWGNWSVNIADVEQASEVDGL